MDFAVRPPALHSHTPLHLSNSNFVFAVVTLHGTGLVPGLVGVPKEPKPWEATLPPPVVKVPLGFCSLLKDDDWPKLKALAPLFPNRLLAPKKQQQ